MESDQERINPNGIEITWNNLTVRTKAGKIILSNISGQIKAGTAVGLLGPSGCGKTTLLSVLTGTTKELNVTGDIFFNGEPISSSHTKNLIAYVSQELVNYEELTAIETMLYYASSKYSGSEIIKKSDEVLKSFGLSEHADTLYSKLSGGQKLRLSIAMAVLIDSPIIILDEPTSGLDSQSAMIVIEKMEELAKSGKTLLISIHQPSEEILRIFDGFILMCKGCIAFMGTIPEATEHFKSLGYENNKENVNSAEYFSRLVSVDFRSRELSAQSSVIVEKVRASWVSKKLTYKPCSKKITFVNKTNLMFFKMLKNLFKFDFRDYKGMLLYLGFIIFTFIYFNKDYYYDNNQINYKAARRINSLLKGGKDKLTETNVLFDELSIKVKGYEKKYMLNSPKETPPKFECDYAKYIKHSYYNGLELGSLFAYDIFEESLFLFTIFFVSVSSAGKVLPVLIKEYNNGLFYSFEIAFAFIFNSIPYIALWFVAIINSIILYRVFIPMVILKFFAIYFFMGIALHSIELSILCLISIRPNYLVNGIRGVKMSYCGILKFLFENNFSIIADLKKEYRFFKVFFYNYPTHFKYCFINDTKKFLIDLAKVGGFAFGAVILLIIIITLKFTNFTNYKKARRNK